MHSQPRPTRPAIPAAVLDRVGWLEEPNLAEVKARVDGTVHSDAGSNRKPTVVTTAADRTAVTR